MAKSLEEIIREVAARGILTHLSVVAVAGGWSAQCSGVHGQAHERDSDPVEALKAALISAPKTRPRADKPVKDEDSMDFG
jgi:hypothetical protein